MMGRLVRWTKYGGWTVGPTPYQHHIAGLHLFQRLRFKGPRPHTMRQSPRAARQCVDRPWTLKGPRLA